MKPGVTRYTAADLCVLVPTFKRPEKLGILLESFVRQGAIPGRVIVVDGAEDAEPVVREYADRIPAEYHRCHPPGQIRQRNYGLSLLAHRDKLVALLDDDIVLEPGAIQHMIAFWNEAEPETAGVCFNIVNGPVPRHSKIGRVLGLSHPEPGRVLRSGMTTANTHVRASARVQWLPGGATVWRKDILLSRSHREVNARWAIGEDLIFSYPTGKEFPLYVCADARVRHEHVHDYGAPSHDRYHGRTQTVWMYHFVASNPDLSRVRFVWTLIVRMVGKTAQGILRRDRAPLAFAAGQASALREILRAELNGSGTAAILGEKTSPGGSRDTAAVRS